MKIFSKPCARPFANVIGIQGREMLDDAASLVDVRTSQQSNAGPAPVARRIALDTLDHHEGSPASGTTGVTICKSGRRSLQAARILAAQGSTGANVTGGMFARQRSGGPVVSKPRRDGTVA
jgi:rhodanese-related sulfurtransferase